MMRSLLLSLLFATGAALGADPPAEVTSAGPAAAPAAVPATGPAARRSGAAAAKAPGKAGAHDRLELDTTSITGNRELPKVMVIVPWKKSEIGDLTGQSLTTLIDEALQPVDRDVFRREIRYHEALAPDRPRSETRVTSPPLEAAPNP